MNTEHPSNKESDRIRRYDNDIELLDYFMVVWKWKYVIIAVTLAFGLASAIISLISLKQQPTMYRTTIILKPGVLTIDEKGKDVFLNSPENIKTLIENDIKYKMIEGINGSKRTELLNLLDFQIEMSKGSNEINVSLESASAEFGTNKLNELIKVLSDELSQDAKLIKEKIEKRLRGKKDELKILLLKEKEMKSRINEYEKKITDIESKIKLLKERKDNSPSGEYFLNKLSVENDYLNIFQVYFKEKEKTKFELYEAYKKTNNLSKEIEKLEKEIENFQNIQIIQIVQPPFSIEVTKTIRTRRNVLLSGITGFLFMTFLAFILEYIKNLKNRLKGRKSLSQRDDY